MRWICGCFQRTPSARGLIECCVWYQRTRTVAISCRCPDRFERSFGRVVFPAAPSVEQRKVQAEFQGLTRIDSAHQRRISLQLFTVTHDFAIEELLPAGSLMGAGLVVDYPALPIAVTERSVDNHIGQPAVYQTADT